LLAGLLLLVPARAWAGDGNPGSLTLPEREAVRKYFDAQVREVDERIRRGRYEKAMELAKALLVLAPGIGEDTGVLRAMKNRARDGLQAASVVRGEVVAPDGFHEVGDRLVFRVVLTNVSQSPLEIDMGEEGEGAANLRIRFTEEGSLGGLRVAEWNARVSGLRGRRVIEPGGAWETEAVLDTGDRSPVNPTARTYAIRGQVRPARMRLGKRPLARPVWFEETVVRVYPRGLAPMRRAPLETLKEGVEEEFGPKVVLAASLVPEDRRREAGEYLVAEQDREFDRAAMPRVLRTALRVLSGRPDIPVESAAWGRWWPLHGRGVLEGLKAGKTDPGAPPEAPAENPGEEDAGEEPANPFEE
jgi:hypothetical protein